MLDGRNSTTAKITEANITLAAAQAETKSVQVALGKERREDANTFQEKEAAKESWEAAEDRLKTMREDRDEAPKAPNQPPNVPDSTSPGV